MKISLDEMATFVEVVDSGSFSRASQKSDVPVSTVSRRISELERRLQVQLLHRTTRKQSLTDIGAVYYEHCSRMLQEAEAAELAVQNLQAEPTGVMRVTAPFSLDDPFSSSFVERFMLQNPKIQMEFFISTREVDLIEEKYDAAIVPGYLEDSSLIARGIGSYRVIYCASKSYIEKHGLPTEDNIHKHQVLNLEPPGWLGIPKDPLAELSESRFLTNDFFLARRLCVDGQGIVRMPEMNLGEYLKQGDLIEVMHAKAISIPLNIVFPSNKQFTTKLRAFVDLIVEHAAEHAPWDFD